MKPLKVIFYFTIFLIHVCFFFGHSEFKRLHSHLRSEKLLVVTN